MNAVLHHLAAARHESRQDVIGRLLEAISDALNACDFADIEVSGEEINQNLTADVWVCLMNAKCSAEKIR